MTNVLSQDSCTPGWDAVLENARCHDRVTEPGMWCMTATCRYIVLLQSQTTEMLEWHVPNKKHHFHVQTDWSNFMKSVFSSRWQMDKSTSYCLWQLVNFQDYICDQGYLIYIITPSDENEGELYSKIQFILHSKHAQPWLWKPVNFVEGNNRYFALWSIQNTLCRRL